MASEGSLNSGGSTGSVILITTKEDLISVRGTVIKAYNCVKQWIILSIGTVSKCAAFCVKALSLNPRCDLLILVSTSFLSL